MLSTYSHSTSLSRTAVSAIIVASCLVTVGLAYLLATGDTIGLLVVIVPIAALLLFLAPTWLAIMLYFVYSAFSPLLKYVSSYNSIIHLAPTLILAPILLRWIGSRYGASAQGKRVTAPIPASLLVKAFVALALLMMFSPLTSPVVAVGGIISYVLPIAFLPLAFYELRTVEHVRIFLALTVVTSVLGSALSLLFVARGRNWVARLGPQFARTALDPSNVYFDARGQNSGWLPIQVVSDVTGYMIALVLLVALITVGNRRWTRGAGLFVVIPTGLLMATALITSGIRITVAGAAVGLLVVALAGRRRAIVPVVVGLLFGSVVLDIVANLTHGAGLVRFATLLNPGQALQSSGRTSLLQQIVPLAVDHPLGQGMGRVGPGAGSVIAASGSSISTIGYDNMLLAIMSELGVLGGVLLVSIAVAFIVGQWRVYRRLTDRTLRAIALGCLAATVASISTWIAGPTLFQAPGSIYYWALAGLCFALPRIEAARAAGGDGEWPGDPIAPLLKGREELAVDQRTAHGTRPFGHGRVR